MKKNLKSKINQTVNAKIMEQKVFKTAYQEEQEAKDMAIYNEWNELMSVPGQSATGVTQHLMQKYNIHSSSTIWVMRKRAENGLKGRENYEYKVKPRSCTSQVRVQQEIPATVLGEKAASKRAAAQQQIQTEPVSVSRNGMDDQRYITALEASNKTLNSENRRLVRLLHNYQKIIAQSTVAAL